MADKMDLEVDEVNATQNAPGVRAYEPPRLDVLGDVRDLTLGGSFGNGDSGSPEAFKPLG